MGFQQLIDRSQPVKGRRRHRVVDHPGGGLEELGPAAQGGEAQQEASLAVGQGSSRQRLLQLHEVATGQGVADQPALAVGQALHQAPEEPNVANLDLE